MRSSLLPVAISLVGLASGCKDEKLKECMGKVEELEKRFESTCEWKSKHYDGSPELNRLDHELYEIVGHRNEIWAVSDCGTYQVSWICDYVGKDSLGSGNYSVDFDYKQRK